MSKIGIYTVYIYIEYHWIMLPWHEFLISARTGQHLKKNFAAHLQSWHVFFGSLFLASILRFEELTQLLYILLLILEKDLPWSHVQHELGIQTTSIQRLNIFRQPWLKTLPAEVSYLSSNISTSAKFLISMAHLLDPKGSVITPPLLNLSEHLSTSATCQMDPYVQPS